MRGPHRRCARARCASSARGRSHDVRRYAYRLRGRASSLGAGVQFESGGRQMPKRVLLIAGMALAVLAASSSATATSRHSGGAASAAAPFAESWANVPRTSAARRAKDVLVFGQEQDIVGFNALLTCCTQFWGAVQTVPVIRGAYNVDNKLRHVLDLVSDAKATKTTLSFTIRPNANWNWGGKKLPVTYKDFVYTWKQ